MLLGIVGNVLAQPASGEGGDNQGGRYRLIVVNSAINSTSYSTPYVIDTQTGRVWRQAVDADNKMFVFVSVNYQNIEGELSKVPNETATGIVLKNKAGQGNDFPNSNSTANSQSTASELQKLRNEASSANAAAQFWQQQLANIKAGKQWTALQGWDNQGKPIAGPPQPPSDSAAETVQRYVNQAQAQKNQIQQ